MSGPVCSAGEGTFTSLGTVVVLDQIEPWPMTVDDGADPDAPVGYLPAELEELERCRVCGHDHGGQGACVTRHAFVLPNDCRACIREAAERARARHDSERTSGEPEGRAPLSGGDPREGMRPGACQGNPPSSGIGLPGPGLSGGGAR